MFYRQFPALADTQTSAHGYTNNDLEEGVKLRGVRSESKRVQLEIEWRITFILLLSMLRIFCSFLHRKNSPIDVYRYNSKKSLKTLGYLLFLMCCVITFRASYFLSAFNFFLNKEFYYRSIFLFYFLRNISI